MSRKLFQQFLAAVLEQSFLKIFQQCVSHPKSKSDKIIIIKAFGKNGKYKTKQRNKNLKMLKLPFVCIYTSIHQNVQTRMFNF